jgi:hypothetical protein
MKRWSCPLLVLIGVLLCGCPSVNLTVFQPTPIETSDTYTHQGSGMPFPVSVGYFRRGQITQYDPEATDIGVGYNLPSIRYQVAITVYVYPGPGASSIGSPDNVVAAAHVRLLETHFEYIKAEIVHVHPDATLVSEGPTTMDQGQVSYDGLKAVFEFEGEFFGQEQPLASQAYLFSYGKWFVKYRITYPKDSEERALSRIEDFMAKFAWSQSDESAEQEGTEEIP